MVLGCSNNFEFRLMVTSGVPVLCLVWGFERRIWRNFRVTNYQHYPQNGSSLQVQVFQCWHIIRKSFFWDSFQRRQNICTWESWTWWWWWWKNHFFCTKCTKMYAVLETALLVIGQRRWCQNDRKRMPHVASPKICSMHTHMAHKNDQWDFF